MSEMNVTRRNFLSGAALVSAAIAGAGLAGCAPQSAAPAASSSSAGETLGTTGAANSTVGFDGTGTLPWLGEAPAISDDQVEEELTADVVVVGLGTSGLVAASAAAKEGAKVIGLDRSASMGATNAAMVSGVWAVESSPELQYDNHLTTKDMFDFIWTSTHYQTNAPLLRNVLPASGKGIDLMIEGGVPFMFAFEGADESTLMLNRGGHIFATSGAERAEALQGMLDKFGVDSRWDAEVTNLLIEDGAVVGVRYESGSIVTDVRASNVIIATGGAGRMHYQGFPTSNHYGATADGLYPAYRRYGRGHRLSEGSVPVLVPECRLVPAQCAGYLQQRQPRLRCLL